MRISVLHQQASTREGVRRRNRRLRAGDLNGRSNVARPPPVSVIAPASFALVAEAMAPGQERDGPGCVTAWASQTAWASRWPSVTVMVTMDGDLVSTGSALPGMG